MSGADRQYLTLNTYSPNRANYNDMWGDTYLQGINTAQLIINDEILGVRSKTNRLLIFKSDIMHRATPFKTHQRYTVALKYTNHADTGY